VFVSINDSGIEVHIELSRVGEIINALSIVVLCWKLKMW